MSEPRDRVRASQVPVVILAGGMGTRLGEATTVMPKPMVTIGGHPILWHIMKYYGSFGFTRFVICLGYRGEVITNYFSSSDVIAEEGWTVDLVPTGEHAMTGARIKRVQHHISGPRFLLTYGDGLADVDLKALLQFHVDQDRLVTVTGVHPPSRFGLLSLGGPQVVTFSEKAHVPNEYVNGGYFVCEVGMFDYLRDEDECVLEGDPLERLAQDGQLVAFRHDSYWQCMDTARDRLALEAAWRVGAPWRRW